jgi:hypothetical protein
MNRALGAVFMITCAALAGAQVSPEYAQVANDYGAEFAFSPGRPIELRVEVLGIRFDTVAVTPQGEVAAGTQVPCEVAVDGSSVAEKKATVTVVLLLEDNKGQSLERVTAEPFRVKSGRSFGEKQKREISGDALGSAAKIYVFIQVGRS